MILLPRNNIPKLRFKEFTDEWKERLLSNFVINYKGGAPLAPSDFVKYSNSEVVPKKAIVRGGVLQLDESNPTYCTDEFFAKYNKSVIDNSYLLTTLRDLVPTGPSIGLIVTNPHQKKMILAQGVYGFRLTDRLVPTFLTNISNTDNYRKLMFRIAVGSTQIHIRNSEFFRIKLFVPTFKEQQKIAAFLEAVDAKQNALRRKRELLAEYKRGVMQKLFTQEIRFVGDDGRPFPDWKVKRLRKCVTKVGSGVTPRGGSSVYISKGIPLIRSQNVNNNRLDFTDVAYIPPEIHASMAGSTVFPKDVLLNITGASIGRSCVVPLNISEANVNQHVCIIRCKKEYSPEFLQSFLSSWEGQKLIAQSQAGGGREGLNFENIKSFKIAFPSYDEQRKIANFLNTIEKKIAAIDRQIEQMETFKKGLLQQMFV